MEIQMGLTGILLLFAVFPAALQAQEKPKPPAEPAPYPLLQAVAEEVLLDIVVRDRKGRPVRDLRPEEIEIYEEGARQQVTSFRLAQGGENPPAGSASAPARLDPLRQLNLVTVVFERLGDDGRRLSREAALALLGSELRSNLYLAVFTIDLGLNLLQPFTNDRALLREAIERATRKEYARFASQKEQIQSALDAANRLDRAADQAADDYAKSKDPVDLERARFAQREASLARLAAHSLQYSEEMARTQQGRSSMAALLALVKEQRDLPGRKTLLYFSEGLQVPANLIEYYRTTISEANRANVSVYAVDARGLVAARQMESTYDMLNEAANASRRGQVSSRRRPLEPDEFKAFDIAQDTMFADVQGNLGELADSTGGFLVANTNDLRAPMQHIAEDINAHYELTYVPQWREYDGRFRRISVKVLRPNVKVQTRNGYFALPPIEGSPLLPYEMPMLAALNAKPLPNAFEYHAVAFPFEPQAGGRDYALVVEVPLKNLTFVVDKERKVHRTWPAVLALVKDAPGKVIEKFSQDSPLEAPLDKMQAFQRGNFTLTNYLRLSPGRYTLETAVLDRPTQRVSTRRAALVVPASQPGLAMSSLSLVRRYEARSRAEEVPDPFRFGESKVIPSLGDPVRRAPGMEVSFYFVIYPAKEVAEKPQLVVEFFQAGKLVARGAPELPPPDGDGHIHYVISSPAERFPPAYYEVRATVRQGPFVKEEYKAFTISE